MVVLMESPGGLTLKRKGAEEPGLFLCPGDVEDGFPLDCRATKIRRLVRDDGHRDGPVASAAAANDVPMGEAAEDEGAMVVYEPSDAAGGIGLLLGQWRRRLRPWATLLTGSGWVREMLPEADSRTVRQLLSSASHEEGAGMDVPAPGETEDTVDASEDDSKSSAAMDVEEQSAHQAQTPGSAGYMCRQWQWPGPQHCMPAIAQMSPVAWSW